MKHTPAPWMAGVGDNDGRDFITIEHEGFPICEVRGTDDMSCIDNDEDEKRIAAEMVADARLICAAPEMLEALQRAKSTMERDKNGGYRLDYNGNACHEVGSTYVMVCEAINKAKGI